LLRRATACSFVGTQAKRIIVEVQLDIKERKRRAWLGYTATSVAQLKCEACVLVVTPYESVARWARRPLEFGLGSVFCPLVIGPKEMPVITDVEQAKQDPYLIKSSLSEAARKAFEMLPETYQFQDEALRKSFDKGALQNEVKAILRALQRRNITLSPEQEKLVISCTDSVQLERWFDRAVVAHSADEVFSDE
jgi:hypothetical protein